jgi:hypothetical protein
MGHAEVQKNQIKPISFAILEELDSGGSLSALGHLMFALQDLGEEAAYYGVVVDDENCHFSVHACDLFPLYATVDSSR